MRSAGFRYAFLGIENVLEEDLAFLKASAKNSRREGGRRTGNATLAAIERLHRAGIYVVGGAYGSRIARLGAHDQRSRSVPRGI